MYTHFKRCFLCKMCIHFLAPCIYICAEGAKNYIHTSEGVKKCIHILRDVIYVKCVNIFWAPSVYNKIKFGASCVKTL